LLWGNYPELLSTLCLPQRLTLFIARGSKFIGNPKFDSATLTMAGYIRHGYALVQY